MIYSNLNWKCKSKKEAKQEDSVHMDPPGSSYLEEARFTTGAMSRNVEINALEVGIYAEVLPRNVRKEVECEYAQVKFKQKCDANK